MMRTSDESRETSYNGLNSLPRTPKHCVIGRYNILCKIQSENNLYFNIIIVGYSMGIVA